MSAGGILLHTGAAGVDQAAGRVGGGMGEDILHAALFRHHAAVQNGDPGADLLNDAHLVGDDHHGHAQLGIQVFQQLQNGSGGGGVQSGSGFVTQQDLGVCCQSTGDGNPLLLTA